MGFAVLQIKMSGVILLFVTLLTVYCQGTFYISTRESNWCTASSHCTMGTPPLNYGHRGYLDISGIDLLDNESVWIGYYKVVKVLEYLDCVKLDVFETDKKLQTFEIEGSPGQCFPGCGNASIVGVTLSRCFCIGENYNVTKRSMEMNCTTPCLHPQGAACGLKHKNGSYVSVYKLDRNVTRFPENVPIEIEENNCLMLNRTNNRHFMWKGCSQSFEVGCYSGHQAIHVRDESAWLEAVNKCFQGKLYPSSYETSITVGNYFDTSLWTGHIRSQLVHKLGENRGEDQYGETTFGVLTKTSSGYLLTFQKDTAQRRILCQQRTSSNTKDSSNSFIVTGVILTIAAAVASLFMIAFYKKRKTRKCQQKTKRNVSRAYSYAEISLSSGQDESHQSNNYFILEPHEREVPTSDVSNNVAMHLDDNVAGIIDRKRYDREENDRSIEYNRLGTKQREKIRDNSIEYNRLVIRDGEIGNYVDTVYNKLSTQKYERRRDNTDEYNRIDINNSENGKHTDNVYNRLGIQIEK